MTVPAVRRQRVNAKRDANALQVKRILTAARDRSGVGIKEIGDCIGMDEGRVWRLFAPNQLDYHMRIGDLYALANSNGTREFVNVVLAAFHSMISPHELRVCDVEALANSGLTRDLARMRLRPVLELLFPDEMRATRAVNTVQVPATAPANSVSEIRVKTRGRR